MGLYGSHDSQSNLFNNKIGVVDRRDGLFSNFKIFKKLYEIRQNRREQKLEKALQKIIDQVNTIPRGFGSLPQNKNISLNGYFNYKHPDLQGREHTTLAEVLGIGNDHDTNVRLYAKAMQLIEDSFYNIRHLYQGNPELEAKVENVRALLEIREGSQAYLREVGYEEEIFQLARSLDREFEATVPDRRYKEMAKSGIADVLEQAKKELNLSDKTAEELAVFFGNQKVYFVPRENFFRRQQGNKSLTDANTLEERFSDFIQEHEPADDTTDSTRVAELLEESKRAENERKENRKNALINESNKYRSTSSRDVR